MNNSYSHFILNLFDLVIEKLILNQKERKKKSFKFNEIHSWSVIIIIIIILTIIIIINFECVFIPLLLLLLLSINFDYKTEKLVTQRIFFQFLYPIDSIRLIFIFRFRLWFVFATLNRSIS